MTLLLEITEQISRSLPLQSFAPRTFEFEIRNGTSIDADDADDNDEPLSSSAHNDEQEYNGDHLAASSYWVIKQVDAVAVEFRRRVRNSKFEIGTSIDAGANDEPLSSSAHPAAS